METKSRGIWPTLTLFFLAPAIAAGYQDERLTLLIRVAAIGIFGRLLLGFSSSYFKAVRRFVSNSLVVALSTLCILVLVLIQLPGAGLTIQGALLAAGAISEF